MSNNATHHNVTDTEPNSPLGRLSAKMACSRERYPQNPSYYEQIITTDLAELVPEAQEISRRLERLNRLAFPADAPTEVSQQLQEAAHTAATLSQLLAQLTAENPPQQQRNAP